MNRDATASQQSSETVFSSFQISVVAVAIMGDPTHVVGTKGNVENATDNGVRSVPPFAVCR